MKEELSSTDSDLKKSRSLHDLILVKDNKKTGEFCQKLKTSDVDVLNSYDDNGLTPLCIAIENGDIELVSLLLEYGANPNKRDARGETPIVAAVRKDNAKIVLMLLEEGADLKKTDELQQSILKIANEHKANKCIDILRDYGAFFVKPKTVALQGGTYSGIESFIKNIKLLVLDVVDKDTETVSFDFFYNAITDCIRDLFNKTGLKCDSIKQSINVVFDQILHISANKIFEQVDALNATRRVINSLSKIDLSGDDANNNSLLILSKLENVIEDKIVQCRTLAREQSNDNAVSTGNVITYVEQQHGKQKQQLKFEKSSLVNIETTQIVSKTINHDFDVISFTTISPHHIQDKAELSYLLRVSEYRLRYQYKIFDYSSKKVQEVKNKIDHYIASQEEEISMNNAMMLDKLLRVGKEEQVHILSLSRGDYDTVDTELRNEAIELGAKVYTVEYSKSPSHKLNLVYTCIAAVNKLLDDGIHPDKIFIQCDSKSYDLVQIVISQFANRGIALSEIILGDENFDVECIENNHRCLLVHQQTHKARLSTKYSGFFKEFFKHFSTTLKNSKVHRFNLSTEIAKNYTVIQLIALFIKCNQLFLKQNVKLRNPDLPTDKVDNILGVVPEEV